MGRRSNPSLSLSATVRAWFGLTQAELARALGVSSALVEKVEANKRALPRRADERLEALAVLGPGLADPAVPPPLPPPTPLYTPAGDEVPAPPPPGPLTAAEVREVRHRLARLEREAYRLRVAFAEAHPRRTLLQARWAAALPALQAAADAVPPPPDLLTPAAPEHWLAARAAEGAAPPPPHTAHAPLDVARQALRLHLLTHEIGQLRTWLLAA